jgi:hypothetical protein
MKTLDLNAYGVEELRIAEMQETNGGAWSWAGFWAGALASFIYETATNPKDVAKAWNDGASRAMAVEI